ncbi:constitutive coactivator of peroxisome proliferator-activated receptor gamma [Culex quinquefasciatus]|uniref:constitutive coactivator of peroxisome proliferator-activated receptor gamma n=1 Tax=Culex quinquefasciatus TaxID=7176 RepID=UPI0018E3E59D|nr:constitutive coactivator of peroxisome proliferator-activated receptor gamma [Culex quinquefasciatus]
MGVTGLDFYMRKKVPNGCTFVDIRNEIRKFKSTASPTTLVFDFQSLYESSCRPDLSGVLCGGRYELVFQLVERFLQQLQQLGVKLVFFNDGVFKKSKNFAVWTARHNAAYERELQIIDSVDNGDDLRTLVSKYRRNIPVNTQYPLKSLAKQYGDFRLSVTGETKKEMVAYANSVNALAIISNNSDMMIFRGIWRFWSSKDLSFEKLTTREFSRSALRTHLGLDEKQLALFATLASNNGFIPSEELVSFRRRHLINQNEFQEMAEFVRKPHSDLVVEIFGPSANEDVIRNGFQKSLDYYGADFIEQEQASSEDPMLNFFKECGKAFLYKLWTGVTSHYALTLIDLRDDGYGAEYPTLSLKIILREAAIAVYHCRDRSSRVFITKTAHTNGYAEQTCALEFPQHVEPPTLQELLSTDPAVHAKLADTKLKLYCWIISDNLDHRQLDAIPPKLMPTVATLYFLIEHQVFELFEADLLLYVAYEVVFKKYDMINIRYPKKLDGRAFRVAFLYNAISQHVLRSLNVAGLDGLGYPEYPQFDGVRFHNLYRDWSRGDRNLEQIQPWRIYANIF